MILDKSQYLIEAKRQLNNTNHYCPLTESPQNETKIIIQGILNTLQQKGFINQKQKHYLMGPDIPKSRLFFFFISYLKYKPKYNPETWTAPHGHGPQTVEVNHIA